MKAFGQMSSIDEKPFPLTNERLLVFLCPATQVGALPENESLVLIVQSKVVYGVPTMAPDKKGKYSSILEAKYQNSGYLVICKC